MSCRARRARQQATNRVRGRAARPGRRFAWRRARARGAATWIRRGLRRRSPRASSLAALHRPACAYAVARSAMCQRRGSGQLAGRRVQQGLLDRPLERAQVALVQVGDDQDDVATPGQLVPAVRRALSISSTTRSRAPGLTEASTPSRTIWPATTNSWGPAAVAAGPRARPQAIESRSLPMRASIAASAWTWAAAAAASSPSAISTPRCVPVAGGPASGLVLETAIAACASATPSTIPSLVPQGDARACTGDRVGQARRQVRRCASCMSSSARSRAVALPGRCASASSNTPQPLSWTPQPRPPRPRPLRPVSVRCASRAARAWWVRIAGSRGSSCSRDSSPRRCRRGAPPVGWAPRRPGAPARVGSRARARTGAASAVQPPQVPHVHADQREGSIVEPVRRAGDDLHDLQVLRLNLGDPGQDGVPH